MCWAVLFWLAFALPRWVGRLVAWGWDKLDEWRWHDDEA